MKKVFNVMNPSFFWIIYYPEEQGAGALHLRLEAPVKGRGGVG